MAADNDNDHRVAEALRLRLIEPYERAHDRRGAAETIAVALRIA